jgi:hypothetical protein
MASATGAQEGLQAGEASADEGGAIIDRARASAELIRRVKILQDAFESGRLAGALFEEYELFVPKRRETTLLANRGLRLRSIEDPDTLFRITDDMVLPGAGDSGSDVRKVMQEHVGTHGLREWCISHMLNRCFIDGLD